MRIAAFVCLLYPIATFPYGLAPLEEHEARHLEEHVLKVVDVRLNALGISRLEAQLQDEIAPCSHREEFAAHKLSSLQAVDLMASDTLLPSSVDNNTLPYFPPIGDQAQLGSCVAWGSTYYQASHEIAMLNDRNNKTANQGILSPKWTYDILDGGVNAGLSVLDAYDLLEMNGAPSISSFPYDTNYTAWDLNPNDWVAAIYNRMSSYALIPGLGGYGPQNLTAIKTALANGHVLTFASFINSWVFTRVKHDPHNISNNHIGEYAAVYMDGYNGGHFMTVVGYDDNIWIDINGNGQVDSGERGAFLIANSWGSNWGNRGFIWISYDAFLGLSRVSGGPNYNRVPAGIYLNSSFIAATPKAKNYIPKLIAQFSLTQTVRDQIAIQAGASPISSTIPTVTLSDYALANRGGKLAFDGTNPSLPATATFALDLTDLLSFQPNLQRYYLIVSDNTPGDPTQLNSYTLIDLVHSQQLSFPNVPQIYDNTTGSVFLDYDFLTAD